jgi:hypothetical protein
MERPNGGSPGDGWCVTYAPLYIPIATTAAAELHRVTNVRRKVTLVEADEMGPKRWSAGVGPDAVAYHVVGGADGPNLAWAFPHAFAPIPSWTNARDGAVRVHFWDEYNRGPARMRGEDWRGLNIQYITQEWWEGKMDGFTWQEFVDSGERLFSMALGFLTGLLPAVDSGVYAKRV